MNTNPDPIKPDNKKGILGKIPPAKTSTDAHFEAMQQHEIGDPLKDPKIPFQVDKSKPAPDDKNVIEKNKTTLPDAEPIESFGAIREHTIGDPEIPNKEMIKADQSEKPKDGKKSSDQKPAANEKTTGVTPENDVDHEIGDPIKKGGETVNPYENKPDNNQDVDKKKTESDNIDRVDITREHKIGDPDKKNTKGPDEK